MLIVMVPAGLFILAFIIVGIKMFIGRSVSRKPIDNFVLLSDFSKIVLGDSLRAVNSEIVRRLTMVKFGCPRQLVFRPAHDVRSTEDAVDLLNEEGYAYSKGDIPLIEDMVHNAVSALSDMEEAYVTFVVPSGYCDTPKADKWKDLKADFVSRDSIAAIYPCSISKLLMLWRMALHSVKKYRDIRYIKMYDPAENVIYEYDTDKLNEKTVKKLDKQLGFR